MDEHQKGVQLGLRAAAMYLESEADDIMERKAGQSALVTAKELADFLRKHAEEVRQLRVLRGS